MKTPLHRSINNSLKFFSFQTPRRLSTSHHHDIKKKIRTTLDHYKKTTLSHWKITEHAVITRGREYDSSGSVAGRRTAVETRLRLFAVSATAQGVLLLHGGGRRYSLRLRNRRTSLLTGLRLAKALLGLTSWLVTLSIGGGFVLTWWKMRIGMGGLIVMLTWNRKENILLILIVILFYTI